MEESRQKMQNTVEDTLKNLVIEFDKRIFRKLQIDMHRCALGCYERSDYNFKTAGDCADRCQMKVRHAESVMQQCTSEYTKTLNSCLNVCADSIRFVKEPNEEDERKVNSCLDKCISSFVSKQKSVLDLMLESVKNQ